MAIGPVILNGAVTRVQDYAQLKQNEDTKGVIDQNNFQTQFNREIGNKLNQVHESDNAENGEAKYDAKEKGNGSYDGDGGKRREQQDEKSKNADGRVISKTYSNFDIKI